VLRLELLQLLGQVVASGSDPIPPPLVSPRIALINGAPIGQYAVPRLSAATYGKRSALAIDLEENKFLR
jgi:hypothetical protein